MLINFWFIASKKFLSEGYNILYIYINTNYWQLFCFIENRDREMCSNRKKNTKFSGLCGLIKPKIKLFGINAKLMLD